MHDEGSRPAAETGPVCLTIKSGVGWEGGQGYASLTDTWNKTAEEKRILCHTTLVARGAKKDWVVASVDDRVGASSGIPEAEPGWQPSHFQLTTTLERTQGLDGRVAEGGSRLWPQLYRGGGGMGCQGRGMATDGNVAQSGAFPGSSQHPMAWMVGNLELVHRRDTCHRRFSGKESLQRLTNWICISSTTSVLMACHLPICHCASTTQLLSFALAPH